MYTYYTQHKDSIGRVTLTELKLTSYKNSWGIRWKSPIENALFSLYTPILKFPPIAVRSYDAQTNIWLYLDDWGAEVLLKLKAVSAAMGGALQVEVLDLASIAMLKRFDPAVSPRVLRSEDFFYQQAPVAPQATLSKEQLLQKLSESLSIGAEILSAAKPEELKKFYRDAALKLHPDRNGGDGAKMSELNMLWKMYNV